MTSSTFCGALSPKPAHCADLSPMGLLPFSYWPLGGGGRRRYVRLNPARVESERDERLFRVNLGYEVIGGCLQSPSQWTAGKPSWETHLAMPVCPFVRLVNLVQLAAIRRDDDESSSGRDERIHCLVQQQRADGLA